MPKIIKRGSLPQKNYTGKCLSCGCEAEWKPTEVAYEHHQGEPYGATTGRCPQCGKPVRVAQKD
jgi:endogenous inhibitor of DNA gyrase (YacG/DUF329 family)